MSSSEDDGTDDWKPTQDESEGYSEEEEEQERKRIPKVAMKNKAGCPMPQREVKFILSFGASTINPSKMSQTYCCLL